MCCLNLSGNSACPLNSFDSVSPPPFVVVHFRGAAATRALVVNYKLLDAAAGSTTPKPSSSVTLDFNKMCIILFVQ